MLLRASYRKAMLLTHILASAGWIGAVAVFLVLAFTGLYSRDAPEMRGVYMSMEAVTTRLIVPLSFLSLVTGVVQALFTPWGLFRHYWILFKFLINLVSLPILLLHIGVIHRVAVAARINELSVSNFREDRVQLVVASLAAFAALFVAMLLSVFKPKGVTGYGRR